jgi:hypothetical protein
MIDLSRDPDRVGKQDTRVGSRCDRPWIAFHSGLARDPCRIGKLTDSLVSEPSEYVSPTNLVRQARQLPWLAIQADLADDPIRIVSRSMLTWRRNEPPAPPRPAPSVRKASKVVNKSAPVILDHARTTRETVRLGEELLASL